MLWATCTFGLIVIVVNFPSVTPGAFFNLSSDFDESINLFSLDESHDIISTLQQKAIRWSGLLKAPSVPDLGAAEGAWSKCGGVCPWIENDDLYSPFNVEVKYTYYDAPNIVMVMVDDWGWNDIGFRSTYMNWTTPTIDSIAEEGIKLENYFTHETCVPSRGALMTGRYALRLGLWDTDSQDAELPLDEVTLAQELKSAGYRSYMVGKWHLGMSTPGHLPTNRGFDAFYGFLGDGVGYWDKKNGAYVDLQDNENLVSSSAELSSSLHNSILLQSKAESMIIEHATAFPDKPMFLYYATQLVASPWDAPSKYLQKCTDPGIKDDYTDSVDFNYCAYNVILDEVIANLTCTLTESGLSQNTLLIIMSDNGGDKEVRGNSYPFRGHKGSLYRGGLSGTALVHGNLVPLKARGSTYYGQMHITDWLPTLMGIATNNEWNSSLADAEIDGVDMWTAISKNTASPHEEIVHYVDDSKYSIQLNMLKLNSGGEPPSVDEPDFIFIGDQDPDASSQKCNVPSLVIATSISDIIQFLVPDSISFAVGIVTAGSLVIVSVAICWIALTRRRMKSTEARIYFKDYKGDVDFSHTSPRSSSPPGQGEGGSPFFLSFSEYSSWSEDEQGSVPGFDDSDTEEKAGFLRIRYQYV